MSEEGAADWLRMFKKLTDPEEREKARLLWEQDQRRKDRMADTGAYVIEPIK